MRKLFTFLFAALMSVGMFAAQQVFTWSAQFCHDVEAYYSNGQIITANNSKDGITVTYSGSDVNDLDGMRIGGIFLTGGTNSKMTFTSTVGNISKIEVYYYTNVLEDVPVGWTHENSYDKFVWEGTPAASVDMMKGADRVGIYIRNIDFTIGEAEPAPQPQTIHDSDDAATIETFLSTNNGTEIAELTIDRPVLNNMYNTLCLPFDMDAAQIAASSLNGVEIYELEEVTVANDELFLGLSDAVNAVVAGRPYIVKYSAASQLDDLDFENVTINNADLTAQAVTMNGVTFKGTFTPFVMGIQNGFDTNGGYLFLGQNNVLYWPNTNNPLKPFRAYFYIDLNSGSSNAPLRYGMPARIGRPASTPTGVENVQSDKVQSTKVIENGVLYIIKNGVKYNAQGQEVK